MIMTAGDGGFSGSPCLDNLTFELVFFNGVGEPAGDLGNEASTKRRGYRTSKAASHFQTR